MDEFPQLCVGVKDCSNGNPSTSQQLKFDIIELNGTPISVPGRMDCCVSPLPVNRAKQSPCVEFKNDNFLPPLVI